MGKERGWHVKNSRGQRGWREAISEPGERPCDQLLLLSRTEKLFSWFLARTTSKRLAQL